MFKLNKFGKISCLLGVIALLACLFALYSTNYWLLDGDKHYLSTFINKLLTPVRYISNLFSTSKPSTGPSLYPASIFYVIEKDAIIAFFSLGVVLSILSLMFALKAIKKIEFSIWYATGVFASLSGLFNFNFYVALLYFFIALMLAIKARKLLIT